MNRPAWTAMMDALFSNGVKTILIEKLDRLSRKVGYQEVTIEALEKQGFRLISAHEPDLMTDDPTRIAFRQMVGMFSQYEKTQIVRKLKAARMRKRAQTGRCEGRKPYGSREGERNVLRLMQQLRGDGMGYHTIAAHLNEQQIAPRSGVRWYPDTCRRILARVTKEKGGKA